MEELMYPPKEAKAPSTSESVENPTRPRTAEEIQQDIKELNDRGKGIWGVIHDKLAINNRDYIEKFLRETVTEEGFLKGRSNMSILREYLVNHDIKISGKQNPWRIINAIDGSFIADVRRERKQYTTGSGLL